MAVSQEIMDFAQKEISDQRTTFEETMGRAASFVNDMDVTQKAIIGKSNDARARMDERVNDVNGLKTDIVNKITDVEAKLNMLNDQSTALGEKLQIVDIQSQVMKTDFETLMNKLRAFAADTSTEITRAKAESEQSISRLYKDIKDWANGFQARIDGGDVAGKGQSARGLSLSSGDAPPMNLD